MVNFWLLRVVVAGVLWGGVPLFAQAVEEQPKDPVVETDNTVPTGTQSVTWALPGKAEFTARSDQFAKRGGWTVGQFRDALLKELAAVQDAPADFEKPAAGADAPVGYVEYNVYVPPDYDPARPHGLMAFISAGDGASLGEKSKEILDKHHMIWIGAKGTGNAHAPIFRILAAMHGVAEVKARYTIDDERVYVSGFSGGGRAASIAATLMPDVFTGGFFFCGVNYYRNVGTNTDRYWPGFCPKLDPRILQAAQRNSRFVLQTGSKDSNLENTRDIMAAFKQDRFNALYVEVPDGGHSMPTAEAYEQGITFLDAPLFAKADALYKEAQAFEKRKKYGDACVAYERAAARGAGKPYVADATAKAAKIRKAYTAQVTEVRTLIAGEQPNKAIPAVAQLRALFGPLAERDAETLMKEIAEARKVKKPGA